MKINDIEMPVAPLARRKGRNTVIYLGVAAGLIVWLLIPFLASRGTLDILVFTGLYAIAGLGVAFLLGQCGIVSLAQNVFYGIGAYASAYCTTVAGLHWSVGVVVGMGISAGVALGLGWPILRLSGYFLALATLALATIGHVLFLEWDWLTGGTLGIGGIPYISLFGITLNTPQRFYYFMWPVAALTYWMHWNLLHSRSGFAMRSMRDATPAAMVLGIDVHSLRVRVFVLSAMVGALAGSLFAHYVSFISVDSFGIDRSVSFLLLAVVGGAQSIFGPALGAAFVTLLPNFLSRLGDVHPLLFAGMLILCVVFLPKGIAGLVGARLKRFLPTAEQKP